MTERINATATVHAPVDIVFGVLADPTTHEAIDGTGWVRESLDGERLRGAGQIFRMAMYHDNHPDKHYKMANRVEVFDPPHAIAWLPGQDDGQGNIEFGGWIWRYDLAPLESRTEVTLSYDWSSVPQQLREHIGFPPFDVSHLENSLAHLAELAARHQTQ